MNSIVVLQLVTVSVDVLFICLIAWKYWHNEMARAWLFSYIFFAFWAIADLFQNISVTPSAALIWSRVTDATATLVSALIVRFIFVSIYPQGFKHRKLFTLFVWMTVFIAIVALFTPSFTYESVRTWWGYYPHHTQWFYVLNIFVVGNSILSIGLPMYLYRTLNEIQQKQMRLFIIGFLFPLIGGSISEIIAPAFGVVMPPLTTILFSVTGICMVYAIEKYHFFSFSPALVLNEIFNVMNDLLIVTDIKGSVVLVNKHVSVLTGFSHEALQKKSIQDIVYVSPEAPAPLEYLIHSSITEQRMYIKTDTPKTFVPVMVNKTTVKDGTGVKGAIFIGRDMAAVDALLVELKQKTTDLEASKVILESRIKEIESINAIMIGRELRMAEMKKELSELTAKLALAESG